MSMHAICLRQIVLHKPISEPCGAMSGEEIELLPKVFELYTNYLNPFREETTIKYAIPRQVNISLEPEAHQPQAEKIYDVTGRCIKTLVNEEKEPGYYKVIFEAKELGTGIYFAKFSARGGPASGGETGDYKTTKKLIFIK